MLNEYEGVRWICKLEFRYFGLSGCYEWFICDLKEGWDSWSEREGGKKCLKRND